MLIVTTNDLAGHRVEAVFGQVMGLTVRSSNAVTDFTSSIMANFGGELSGMTQLVRDSRNEVIERMTAEAEDLGANAILAMRYSTSDLNTTWTEVCVYGTAVYVSPIPEGEPGATIQSSSVPLN